MLVPPFSVKDQLVIELTKFRPADTESSSKLLFPIYCVPSPIVKKEPDLIETLSVPPVSFIFKPGVVLLNSTVFSLLTNLSVWIWKPPIEPLIAVIEPLIDNQRRTIEL